MATKSKRRKRRAAAPGLRQQAERALSKREFKQALKQAKVCYRQQPSDEHHRLLERAYLARADDLLRSGMRDAGRSALEALLELGVTEPAVRRELPPLLVAVGLLDRGLADGAESAAEADPRLLTAAADHAVVRPADAPASLPGIREGAAAVRAALEALGEEDENGALARLKGIGRSSPFADWKLLVRGLAAYYRDDASEMQANWDRLDADRLPARIARSLRAMADPASADRNDPQVKRGLGQLTSETLGGPVLSDLYDLRDHLAAGRWKNAVASLGKSLPALRRLDATLAERLVAILHDQTVYHGDALHFADLRSCAHPLPIDPHWNRAEALLAEHPKNDDEGQAEAHWLRYLDDLDGVECFAPAERNLAKALIWERLGEMLAAQSAPVPPSLRPFVGDTEGGQDRAIQCFENCLRLAPDYLAGYQSLAQAQLDWDQSEEAAETYRRLLERFPDDVDALKFLARHYQKRDDCFAALEYARKAHRLKPANPEIIELVWASHVGTARHHALRKEWERGRQAFAAADRVKPSAQDAYYLLARKALFELKARNFDLGEELVERAKGQNGEPTPALLVLAIESTRYDLSRTARSGFQRQWKAALKKRCQSETAGLMSETMAAYVAGDVEYRGRADHLKNVLAYVRRCSRVKWRRDDLRSACLFLRGLIGPPEEKDEWELLEKLARKGRKQFPQDPVFHGLLGERELAKGPFDCNRPHARMCFEQAAKLGEGSQDPRAAAVAERAKHFRAFLEGVGMGPLPDLYDEYDECDEYDAPFGGPFGSPFAGPFGGRFPGEGPEPDDDPLEGMSPGEMFAMFAEACQAMGLDPEEVLDRAARGGPLPIPLPDREPTRGRSQRGNKKKKKKKR